MFLLASAAVLILLAFAHLHRQRRARAGAAYGSWAVLPPATVVAVLVSLHSGDFRSGADGAPLLIVIASDVSLSMGTQPEPGTHPISDTRLERAQSALLPLLRELDASSAPVLVAVTAFTTASKTLLAWSDEPPQVREAVSYVLAPGLLTEPGSDLGAGLAGAVPLFRSLPDSYDAQQAGKYLILVSDGEQNVAIADMAEALAELRAADVRIVALHAGLTNVPEGLPLYDSAGRFIGFEEVGGQLVSVPDQDALRAIAGPDPELGLFVKAEREDASETMLDYMGVRVAGPESAPLRTGLILALWLVVIAALLRYV